MLSLQELTDLLKEGDRYRKALERIRDHKKTCTAGLTGPQPCLDAVVLVAKDALDPEWNK